MYVARERERYWQQIGLQPGTRPIEIDPIEYVDEELYGHVISTCILEIPDSDFEAAIQELVSEQPRRDREYVRSSLEWWVCQGLYPLELDDITLLSSAELTALYEHYELFTVPCLAAKGYRVYAPLERGSFTTEGWPAWSPVDALMTRGAELEQDEYITLAIECRAFPERFFGTPWWEKEGLY